MWLSSRFVCLAGKDNDFVVAIVGPLNVEIPGYVGLVARPCSVSFNNCRIYNIAFTLAPFKSLIG